MKHVMLDIETLGTGRDAAIVSVGAVRFDLLTGAIGGTFHQKVRFNNSMGAIDAKTVEWWFKQSEAARAELLSGERFDLDGVLRDFRSFCNNGADVDGLWSNGPTFDEIIMRDAFARMNMHWPIHYRASRCCRTMFALGDSLGLPRLSFDGVKHDALADAINQVKVLTQVTQYIYATQRSVIGLSTKWPDRAKDGVEL